MPKYSGNDYELRVGRSKMEDKGEYVVKAVNSFGSKEECAMLNVERTIYIYIYIYTYKHIYIYKYIYMQYKLFY